MRITQLTLLGATGSIGASTLSLIRLQPERFRLFAVSGHRQIEALAKLCLEFQPRYAALTDAAAAKTLSQLLAAHSCPTVVLSGEQALIDIATAPEVDGVMAAIVGAAGLKPTYAAIKAGKTVYLANKEALVMAGEPMMQAVQRYQATLLPVDSEHNAIFQCLPEQFLAPRLFPKHASSATDSRFGISKIILTASGGAFRDFPLEQFSSITPEAACRHPTWLMGEKITVDSATMVNKALEVIEAHYLFGLAPVQIEVLIHPQSLVHSLVAYQDGSLLAQLGEPDMRTPIANAMAWPERIHSGVNSLDLCQAGTLNFKAVETERYPAFQLGYSALALGGTAPCIFNAANEVAVAAFLAGQIRFIDIARLNALALERIAAIHTDDLDAIIEADHHTRAQVQQWVATAPSTFL